MKLFVCTLNPPQLTNLWRQLKAPKNRFIAADTKEANFKHVFNEPLPDDEGEFERVTWINNSQINKHTLFQLINETMDKKIMDRENRRSLYNTIKQYFWDGNKDYKRDAIKTSYGNWVKGKEGRCSQLITIVETVKKATSKI